MRRAVKLALIVVAMIALLGLEYYLITKGIPAHATSNFWRM